MPTNEDGEFELTLGNRQLLSVFFIVVILLGVFFTMGYIVGRNSAPLTADVSSMRKESAKPLVVESPARVTDTAPPVVASTPSSTTETTRAPEPIRTVPARTEPKPEPKPEKKAEAVKETPKPPKVEPVKPTKAETKAAKAETTKAAGQPTAGQSYLQLAATSKREADVMIDVLQQKGFKALAAEIPEKAGTFRVLVGPIADGATNKTRTDLQGAGFPGNAAIRRTF